MGVAHMPRVRKSLLLPYADQADYTFRASLGTTYGRVTGVPCTVLLPKRVTDAVVLKFYPSRAQLPRLQASPVFSLRGRTRWNDRAYEFRATEVWVGKGPWTGHRQGIAVHSDFSGEPIDFEFRWYERRKVRNVRIERGTFWLTPHRLVNAALSLERSYTGAVRVRIVTRPRFTLRTGITLHFRHHFKYVESGADETATFSELVAEFKPKRPLDEASLASMIGDLDDWLLLASLAARHRCVCTGYEYSGSRTFVTFYRRNLTLPTKREVSFNETLIDVPEFYPFMRMAYRTFGRSNYKELLRQAIYPLADDRERTLESSYMGLFSGLESAFLSVARSQGWNKKQWPTISDGFKLFQTTHNVDLSDLWPLLDKSKGKTLTQIRNRVVHGDYLSPAQLNALGYAELHLRWTLERVVLALVGWPISSSRAAKSFLASNMTAHSSWQQYRNTF